MEDKTINLETEKMIENYSNCKYKEMLKISEYIKGLLVSTLNNCLTNINSENLIGKAFSSVYKDIKEKENNELNGITEKYISRKNYIRKQYYTINSNDENIINNINILKEIDFFFGTLFVEEVIWCLEYLKEDGVILNKEQEDIYLYLYKIANMYLDLTNNIIDNIKQGKVIFPEEQKQNFQVLAVPSNTAFVVAPEKVEEFKNSKPDPEFVKQMEENASKININNSVDKGPVLKKIK